MMIKIYNADTADYDISVEGLNNSPDIGIINKITLAIQEYYENREFTGIGNKLEEIAKGE